MERKNGELKIKMGEREPKQYISEMKIEEIINYEFSIFNYWHPRKDFAFEGNSPKYTPKPGAPKPGTPKSPQGDFLIIRQLAGRADVERVVLGNRKNLFSFHLNVLLSSI